MLWAIDTETTGLHRFKGARPFLYLAYNGVDYIASRDISEIKNIVEDPDNICIFHNAKFDIHMLRSVGVEINCVVVDTLIAIGLLDENIPTKKLKYLAKTILGLATDDEAALNQWFKDNGIKKDERRYDQVPDEILIPYGKNDVYYTFELWKRFEPQLIMQELWALFLNECKLIHVLVEMEEHGILIDKTKTEALNEKLLVKIEHVKETIKKEFGEDFQFTSNKQLGEKLVSLGVQVKYTMIGNIMVNAVALKSYNHRLCTLIFEYRKLEKLQNTYCKTLLDLIDENNIIHANFMSWSTITGRFSCSEPNLQNIPRPDEDRPETKWIRELFIPKENYTNFYIDYEQIEYRVAAEYFDDKELIERINKGEDVHTIQAQRIFEKDTPTKEERNLAKKVNFAVLYGAGVNALAEIIESDYDTASNLFVKFHKENNVIYDIKKKISQKINGEYKEYGVFKKCPEKKVGYLKNMFKRRYRIPKDQAYKGFNYLCQGTAADIIKHAMVNVHDYLEDKKSNLLLNVHDELCIEVFVTEEYVIPEIKRIMEDFEHMFNVKITTDVCYTKTNWAEKIAYA